MHIADLTAKPGVARPLYTRLQARAIDDWLERFSLLRTLSSIALLDVPRGLVAFIKVFSSPGTSVSLRHCDSLVMVTSPEELADEGLLEFLVVAVGFRSLLRLAFSPDNERIRQADVE